MNKTLLIYQTKKGMTKKLMNLLNDSIGHGDVYNLKDFNGQLDEYDAVIIGTPVYVGHINKQIKKWINKHYSHLKNKRVGVCLCGMNNKEEALVIKNNFTDEQQQLFHIQYLGGAYYFDKLNFMQKFMIKKITGETEAREVIQQDKIDLFIKQMTISS